MRHFRRTCRYAIGGLFALLLAVHSPQAFGQQQLTPDEAAVMLLHTARRAFNEKNYPLAVERFREFLAKHGGHKEAPSAKLGLGLSLLELPQRDLNAAIEPLQQAAGVADFPDRPLAMYYLGYCQRGLGHQALALAIARPPEAAQHRATAQQRFDQAAAQFHAAFGGFSSRAKPPAPDAKEPSIDQEWAARSRCDLAEMQVRLGKFKEAQATTLPFTNDATLAKSRYRPLGLYHHGHCCFVLREFPGAIKWLSQLAPFEDHVFGAHARYLLARTHHLLEERPEALANYDAVLTSFDQQKRAAQQQLQNPNALKDNVDERTRLEALVKNPPPEYVARTAFYQGVLQYELGKTADALTRFSTYAQQFPNSPLLTEAAFRQGLCQVQLKQYAEASKTLAPLEQQLPALADQVLLWLARAQVGAADVANQQAYDQALRTAMDTLRRAAERAQQLANADPDARLRRGEILHELGDTQQMARQFKEAAATYNQLLQEKLLPSRLEEAMQRQATALHLAGQYRESDEVCQRFIQTYPKSTLMPDIAFRQAENAYLTATAAYANANLPNRSQELSRLFGEAGKRYQHMIEKYPEFPHVQLARFGLAMSHYQLGEYEKAVPVLAAIPQGDRNGSLVTVPYVLADCVIRTTPTEADDALAAGRIQEQLGEATKHLESFLSANATAPQAPDALLKLGHCQQQLALLLIDPAERNKGLQTARGAYERVMQQFANHPLQPFAVFERARCVALQGDVNGAINELNRFNSDPLKNAPVAPLALLRLSSLLRGQNKFAEAATLLANCRAAHEANLVKDPARLEQAVLIRYHQGLALRESGKLPEARAVFESITRDFAARPESADALWRIGQCRKDESTQKLEVARKLLTKPGAKPEELTGAGQQVQEGLKNLRDTVQYFHDQAAELAKKAAGSEPHLRMLYEAAWCCQILAREEIDAAKLKIQQEAMKKRQEELARLFGAGQPVPALRPPDVPLAAVAIQPAEQRARELYKALITAAPDAALAGDARFELAEMLSQRDELDPAIQLLQQALEKDLAPDLVERLRLRLGSCLLAKKDPRGAFAHFDAIAQNAKSPLAGEARYRAAECLMQQGAIGGQKENWAQAIQQLAAFRDQQPLQNIPNVSDRALLRLGHAYAQSGQWDQSRQAMEILLQRFPQSTWAAEARYGIGWALQNQKQFDQAINHYLQVTASTAAEVAAKAQLQMGLCRVEQKRLPEAANALLVVPFTYDYPDLSALALCEASRVFAEMKQPTQATKLLERVIKDHPQSQWAEVAKQRLTELR